MTLKELQIGKSAIVDAVGGAGALRQHFLDMGVVPGAEIKLMKILFEAIAVLQGDHRTALLCDRFIVAAGIRTVEVNPLDFAAVVGAVGVGLIAVEEDDIARIGGADLSAGFDETLPALNIHKKKAVKGLAADTVARHVVEVSDDHRIEEELLREGTGGIDVEVGAGLNVLFGR